MTRNHLQLVVSATRALLVVSVCSLAGPAMAANADDELDKILEQGLKKLEDKKDEAPPAPVKKDPPKPAAKPEEAKAAPAAPAKKEKPVEPAAKSEAPAPRRVPVAAAAAHETAAPAAPASLEKPAQEVAAKPEPKATAPAAVASELKVAPADVKANAAGNSTPKPTEVKPAQALEQRAEPPATASAKKDDEKPWALSLGLDTAIGLGSFVKNPYAANAYVGQSLKIEPSWTFKLPANYKIALSASQGLSWEFTKADSSTGRYFDWADTVLRVSSKLVTIPGAGIDVSAGLAGYIPISLKSRHAGLVTGLNPTLSLKRGFAWEVKPGWNMKLSASYGFGFRYNFYRSKIPVQENTQAANLPPTVLIRGGDQVLDKGVGIGGANNEYSLRNNLSLAYSPHDLVTLSVSYGISNGFKYALYSQRDEFTSANAKTGPGRSDMTVSSIDLTVDATSFLSLSFGVATEQPPFGPDNKTLYPPFINAVSANSNYTSFYLGVAGSI